MRKIVKECRYRFLRISYYPRVSGPSKVACFCTNDKQTHST